MLKRFCLLVFSTPLGESGPPNTASWVALLKSEPALVDTCMAIATRHDLKLQPFESSQQATMHTYRAVSNISERLRRPTPDLTDGILGAVFTLSYCEVNHFRSVYWTLLNQR